MSQKLNTAFFVKIQKIFLIIFLLLLSRQMIIFFYEKNLNYILENYTKFIDKNIRQHMEKHLKVKQKQILNLYFSKLDYKKLLKIEKEKLRKKFN